jgi:hypothetical protein
MIRIAFVMCSRASPAPSPRESDLGVNESLPAAPDVEGDRRREGQDLGAQADQGAEFHPLGKPANGLIGQGDPAETDPLQGPSGGA